MAKGKAAKSLPRKDFGKSELEKLGLFSHVDWSSSANEPDYQDAWRGNLAHSKKSRLITLNAARRKCANQSGYFSTELNYFKPISERGLPPVKKHDEPVAPKKEPEKRKLEESKKFGPFYPAAYPKKSSGHARGDFYATFEYLKEQRRKEKGEKGAGDAPKEKPMSLEKGQKGRVFHKNLYTSPGKLGTGYGYLNVTFGVVTKGVRTAAYPEHMSVKIKDQAPLKPFLAKAFVYTAKPITFFDRNPYVKDAKAQELEKKRKPQAGDDKQAEKLTPFLTGIPSSKDESKKTKDKADGKGTPNIFMDPPYPFVDRFPKDSKLVWRPNYTATKSMRITSIVHKNRFPAWQLPL